MACKDDVLIGLVHTRQALPRAQLDQEYTKCPGVRQLAKYEARVVFLELREVFGASVVYITAHGHGSHGFCGNHLSSSVAEVSKDCGHVVSLFAQEDVRGVEVSMGEFLGMTLLEGECNLREP